MKFSCFLLKVFTCYNMYSTCTSECKSEIILLQCIKNVLVFSNISVSKLKGAIFWNRVKKHWGNRFSLFTQIIAIFYSLRLVL